MSVKAFILGLLFFLSYSPIWARENSKGVSVDPFDFTFTVETAGKFKIRKVEFQLFCAGTQGFFKPMIYSEFLYLPLTLEESEVNDREIVYNAKLETKQSLKNPYMPFFYRNRHCGTRMAVITHDTTRVKTEPNGTSYHPMAFFIYVPKNGHLEALNNYYQGMTLRPAYTDRDSHLQEKKCSAKENEKGMCFFHLATNAFNAQGEIFHRGFGNAVMDKKENIFPLKRYDLMDHN